MVTACRACSYANADHARFCARCGSRLASEASEDPLLGTLVQGRYRVVRVLGEGGMGRVYYAEQQLGAATRPLAIKVLRGGHDTIARERFARECEVLVQLTHPSTIRVYDFGELPDHRLFLAMEYVEGRTLASAIREGPLPHAVVDRFVAQIGGAIVEAHRRGIVHRDLKPDNVLLAHDPDEGEFAKVLDFGIAKRSDDAESASITSEGVVVGTPAYMSPEQFSAKTVDARADVYALGLMTFEMLTGERPFKAKSALEWASAHMTEPLPSFDDFPTTRLLPDEKRRAIQHALAKEPSERTPSVRAFLRELLGARAGEAPLTGSGERVRAAPSDAETMPATPSAPSPLEAREEAPLALPMRRSWLPWAVITSLVLAGALGAALLATRGGSPGLDALDAGDAGALDAGAAATSEPHLWFHMVSGEAGTRDVTNVLGPPDGRCAVIEPGGKILLELEPGLHIHTDGTPAADLQVVVSETSAPYRVDVLVVRREDRTPIGIDVLGSIAIDVDQFEQTEFRYVRVKNTNREGDVCVDAVGVLAAQDHPRDAGAGGAAR